MGDPRQNVQPGQKLQIAAQQINFLNGLMRQGGGFGGAGLAGWPSSTTIIYGKNVGSEVAQQGYAQAITGIAINPAASLTAQRHFLEMPCVEFEKLNLPPTGSSLPPAQPPRICVPMEPIAADKVGRVVVGGVTQVWYTGAGGNTIVPSPWKLPPFAAPQTGGGFMGTHNSSAAARVLWAPDGPGFAIVQLTESGNRLHFGKAPVQSPWLPNQRQGVELYDNGPSGGVTGTVQVANTLFHPIAADSWVVVWSAPDGDWYVLSAGKWSDGCAPPVVAGHDLGGLPGYDAQSVQVLGHEYGCLKWLSTTECPP